MNCKHCQKPITLIPSAAERAAKDVTGKTAEYYTKLFDYHSACTLALREQSMTEFLRRRAQKSEPLKI